MRRVLVGAQLLWATALFGQSTAWDWGGYGKDLVTWSDGVMEDLPVQLGPWQNTVQLRLNLFWYPMQNLRATVQNRNLITYQPHIGEWMGWQNLLRTDSYYFDLSWEESQRDLYMISEVDRLSFEWIWHQLQITAGRQRIAWGTCLVWNPTDLFNPFDILDFDYEERPGTDALSVQYYTGPISQFDLAVTPGRRGEQVIYAGRYQLNRWDYDFNLIAGWQRKSLRMGFSWAGAVYDGGFRGEILFSNPDIHYRIPRLGISLNNRRWIDRALDTPFWTVALSYDYTFENSLYLHFEYLYNGAGTTANAGYRRFDTIYTGELTPARHSLFPEAAYQLTPLLRAGIFALINPSDQSWIAAPSLQYSATGNLEIMLIAFPSAGEPGTEFGDYPDQYYARMKFSF